MICSTFPKVRLFRRYTFDFCAAPQPCLGIYWSVAVIYHRKKKTVNAVHDVYGIGDASMGLNKESVKILQAKVVLSEGD